MSATGEWSMETTLKTNRLALISFICGLVALLSLGLYYAFFAINNVTPSGPFGPTLVSIMDLTVPVRNLFSTVALITGILALLDIKKKEGTEKGKFLAWAGILLGAAWFLFRLVVGLIFILSELMN
jgi:hypothetical protein